MLALADPQRTRVWILANDDHSPPMNLRQRKPDHQRLPLCTDDIEKTDYRFIIFAETLAPPLFSYFMYQQADWLDPGIHRGLGGPPDGVTYEYGFIPRGDPGRDYSLDWELAGGELRPPRKTSRRNHSPRWSTQRSVSVRLESPIMPKENRFNVNLYHSSNRYATYCAMSPLGRP